MTPTITSHKTITILTRYYVKRTGTVICQVRNGGGKIYLVTLNRNKQHSCQCEGNAKWHKQCYHIGHCVWEERARAYRARDTRVQRAQPGEVIYLSAPDQFLTSENLIFGDLWIVDGVAISCLLCEETDPLHPCNHMRRFNGQLLQAPIIGRVNYDAPISHRLTKFSIIMPDIREPVALCASAAPEKRKKAPYKSPRTTLNGKNASDLEIARRAGNREGNTFGTRADVDKWLDLYRAEGWTLLSIQALRDAWTDGYIQGLDEPFKYPPCHICGEPIAEPNNAVLIARDIEGDMWHCGCLTDEQLAAREEYQESTVDRMETAPLTKNTAFSIFK